MKNKEIRDLKESQVVIRRLKKELEQKNRELKIESGLERVRTRAMAMKNSEELADLVATVFNELVHLGFVLTRCYIYIIDPDSLSLRAWTFNTEIGQLPESYHIKYLDLPYYKALINAWKAKKPKFVYELGGAEKKEVDRILFNETEYSRLPEGVKTGMASVDRVFLSYSFNNFGGLQTGGLEQLSDDQMDILYRFGKVFDLTYTRFSDLKQAEAQAREAQIEAALERVRARTMAMRKSEELFEVVNHLYAQIEPFGISTLGISLAIFLEEEDALEYWYSDHLHSNLVKSYKVRGRKHPVYQKIWKGWKNKDPFLKIYLEGDKKREYDDFILKETDFIHLPEELKNDMYNIKVVHFTYSFIKYGIFEAVDLAEPVEENVGLLIRFSKVFEQAYTRFLDLQKAEAQAREAQIEAALERVRSRSMAMRKSEELHEVVNTAFEQILLLNLSLDTCTIDLYENDMKDWKWWSATEGQVYPELFKLPFRKFKIMIDRYKAKKEGRSLVTGLMNKHQSQQFWNYFFQHIDIPPDRRKYLLQKNGIATSSLIFKNTGMTGIRYEQVPFSDEENLILKRFAQSFEQTYTRFLDLKKAEAQAREAQIEAALERVRARTMAMHQSSELSEAGSLLFKQLIVLGIEAESSWITLISPEENSMVIWLTHGTQMAPPRKVKASDHPNFRAEIESWKSGQEFIKISMTKGAFNLASRETFDMELENDYPEEKLVHIQNLRHRFGFLGLATLEPISDTEIAIYNRFNKVFEQTYTRFLDLQKAEKQAREAKIEAALERVRSRSMAMHKSEELRELVFEFYKQIQPFGFAKWGFEIKIAKEDKSGFYCWISPPGARIQPEGFNIPTLDHWVLEKYWSIFENQLPIATIEVSGDDKKRLGLLLLKKSDMKHLPQEVKTNILDTDYVHFSVASMRYGLLKAVDIEPIPEKEINILQRFAKVFEQTYTRFLDLQKAEAQAREAEIQLALERVRARTMAMHRSDELREVVSVLYEQMIPLGLAALGCELILCDEENEQLQYWSAVPEQARLPECYPIQKIIHPFFQKVWKAWKKRTPRLVVTLKGQDKRKFDKLIFEKTAFKNFPENAKNAIRAGKVDVFSLVTMKYGLLEAADVIPLPESKFTILERFAKVFEQTYTRFLDLQKAEAQAREAQIEASLERVRSRTMAMHKSEELSETATVLFQQLRSLGGNLWSAGFVLLEKNEEGEFRMSNPEGEIQLPIYIPNTEDPATKNMYIHWENGADYYAEEAGGQELKNHYNYLVSLPKARAAFQAIMDAGIDLPTWQQWHAAYFSQGYLLVITLEPYKEIDLLKRFAKAFQQTYTRFLDLQKAEAQAREAQIEAALERVRARSMAMHKSDELKEVIACIFEQLQDLEFVVPACSLIFYQKDLSAQHWFAGYSHEVYPESYTIPYINIPYYTDMLESWQKGQEYGEFIMKGKAKVDYAEWLLAESDFKNLPQEFVEQSGMLTPAPMYFADAFNKYGMVEVIGNESIPEDKADILKRVSKVIEQTYTRFLDLQKAEAQAREAMIEAALERIRSRTMAMQRTNELLEVAGLLYKELFNLGIASLTSGYVLMDKDEKIGWNYDSSPEDGSIMPEPLGIPHTETEVMRSITASWKKQEPFHVIELDPKETIEHQTFIAERTPNFPYTAAELISFSPERLVLHTFNFKEGYILMINGVKLTTDQIEMMIRFTQAFELTYTRFLDLQRAEAQTREAEIQLALERVRARTMAMHKSEELSEAAILLYQELVSLGVSQIFNCGYVEMEEQKRIQHGWSTSPSGNFMEGYKLPLTGDSVLDRRYEGWKRKDPVSFEEVGGIALKKHIQFVSPHFGSKEVDDMIRTQFTNPAFFYCGNFTYGYLLIIAHNTLNEEQVSLLARFTKAFEQTYTRFLDLQKAEAQAREAQIEAALERVRAHTMALQNSNELLDAAALMFQQLNELGGNLFATGFVLLDKEKIEGEFWMSAEGKFQPPIYIPNTVDPATKNMYHHWKKGEELYYEDAGGDALRSHYEYLMSLPETGNVFKGMLEAGIKFPEWQRWHAAYFSQGYLLIITREPYEDVDLFKRFARTFDQTYTRFLDLKQVEAREKEAVKQSSLDRVRAEIASMRTSNDLQRITPLIWRELTTLGVPFFRCGVFIVDDENEKISVYLSTPSGESLAAWHSEYDSLPLFRDTVNHWKKQKVYHEAWDKKQFIKFTKSLIDQGLIDSPTRYQAGKDAPEYLALQMIPFEQGMLYVGSAEKLDEEQLAMAKSLAEAFSVAYARYEDFRKLEEAKSHIENTLTELKAAQTQLIHAEKMASLGELTAGIAHEIQNPLNFVNNFSEVSVDLIEDMEEGMIKGNMEEVKAITEDIRQNLEKINHHGKRASDIVKGMLQHSRSNSGQKEAVDINLLAEEYLRLAYHGLRAKDKSFNADFKTDLDESIPKVNVIGQDIGRVLLNLINNAFYAVSDKQIKEGKDYKPIVKLTTKRMSPTGEGQGEENIRISIKDNGPGIPETIRDKIFQPFFTTKPTGQGTGLGLSLSYDIITKGHHGSLEVVTEEGSGTEFIIILPIN